jgi:hypothetical protein
MLAYRLSRPVADIEQMTTAEFAEWVAFFELQQEHTRKAGAHGK